MEIRIYVNHSTAINHQRNHHVSSIVELEAILGQQVVLLKNQRPELGLGGLVNVFRTAQKLKMHLDVDDGFENHVNFVINLHEDLNRTLLRMFKRKYLSAIKPVDDYSIWSEEDYKDVIHFFCEELKEAGWPSKTGNPSGSGRYNNV